MNLVLCLGIVMVCGYIGRQLSKRATQRLDFFRGYESAMVSLADSVTGMSLELSRALEAVRGSALEEIFADCARKLRATPQRRFAAIWQESFEQYSTKLTTLNKEDIRIIMEAGDSIENLCRNPSRKQADGYLRRLEGYIAEVEIDKRKKCRLFSAGGVLAGLFIALLVI